MLSGYVCPAYAATLENLRLDKTKDVEAMYQPIWYFGTSVGDVSDENETKNPPCLTCKIQVPGSYSLLARCP